MFLRPFLPIPGALALRPISIRRPKFGVPKPVTVPTLDGL